MQSKKKIVMSEKEGTIVVVGRPSASGRLEARGLSRDGRRGKADRLKGGFTAYKYLSLPHKAAVPIQRNDKHQTKNLAVPTTSSSSTLILEHNMSVHVSPRFSVY